MFAYLRQIQPAESAGVASEERPRLRGDRTGFLSRHASSKSFLRNTIRTIASVTSNVSADSETASRCNQSIDVHAKGSIHISHSQVSNTCENEAKAIATLKALSNPAIQQKLRSKIQSLAKAQMKNLPTSLMSSTDSNSTVNNYVESVSRITSNAYTRCHMEADTAQSQTFDADGDIDMSDAKLTNNASLKAAFDCIQDSISKSQAYSTIDNATSSKAVAIDSGFDPFAWLTSLFSSELLAMVLPSASCCCLLLCCCMMIMFVGGSSGGRRRAARYAASSVDPALVMKMAKKQAAAMIARTRKT